MRNDEILGLAQFAGAGVYTTLPAELPNSLRECEAVVTAGSLDAALQLAPCCASITFVTSRTSRFHDAFPANVKVLYGSEIICVDGLQRLESVVVRKIRTGAVTACRAGVLFVLNGT